MVCNKSISQVLRLPHLQFLFLPSIYEGVKRTLQCMPNKKSLIIPRHLLSMYNLFKGKNSNLRDLRILTICILAYAGFLTFSEVSVLKRGDIDIQDAYMRLFLEQSKTDIYRSDHWIYIGKLNSVLCPVKITQKNIQKATILKGRSEYLFRDVVKKNSGYRLKGINKPITYTSIREDVLSLLKKLGLSSEDYGLHSMPAGGCTMATHLGVKERFIKKHGRWKSDRLKDGYTHPTLNGLLLVLPNLGL